MATKRYKPEEIVTLLRRAEVVHGRSRSAAAATRQLAIIKIAFDRWCKECGGVAVWRREGRSGPPRSARDQLGREAVNALTSKLDLSVELIRREKNAEPSASSKAA